MSECFYVPSASEAITFALGERETVDRHQRALPRVRRIYVALGRRAADAEFSDEALSAMTMRLAAHPKWAHMQWSLELLATAFWALSDWGPYPWLGLAAAAVGCRWSACGAGARTAGGVVNEMEGFEMVGGDNS